MTDITNLPSLYSVTGDIKDINTLLISRDEAVQLTATVPNGWVLVPVKADLNQLCAGEAAWYNWGQDNCITTEVNFQRVYKAMLSATPAAPQPAPTPRKIEIPPPGADALDVAFSEGWNQCCDAYFGGLPPQAPLVVTVFKTNSDTAEAAPQQAQQPLKDEKEALDLLNAENARLTKLVLAYRGQRNHHNLAEKISDMMTFAGCSLSEYQQAVLAAGLRAILEPRTEDTQ